MPTRPLHPCSRCSVNLTRNKGVCDTCATKANRLRGSAASRGYNDRAYRAWKEAVHEQDNGLCQACLSTGIVRPGRVADHIVPRSAGGSQYDVGNGQTLCDYATKGRCHDVKRHAEAQGRQLQVVDGKGLVDIGPLGTPARRWARVEASCAA